jgi:hypothetical protein
MENLVGKALAALALVATVAVISLWQPVASAKNSVVTCLDLQRQAAGSGPELQKKADDFCKLADAQTKALRAAVK